jgi:hypothetical protein
VHIGLGVFICRLGAKTMDDPRIAELLALAETEGITLPYPPEMIIALEDVGAVVNLRTGAILPGEADKPYVWEWTTVGEAVAHLMSLGTEAEL